MTKIGLLKICSVALAAVLIGGCGGGPSGVEAEAPGGQDRLTGTAPDSGPYTLYRATGFLEDRNASVEPVWTVSVSQGQKIGFRWQTDEARRYAPGGFHLVAFAGGQSQDLGPIEQRDIRYVWAGAHDDVAGYFHSQGVNAQMQILMMR